MSQNSDIIIRISVVIPRYNQGQFLNDAIESVQKSTFEDYEMIIVNDGSTDILTQQIFRTLEERFRNHPRVKIIHQENQGLGGARNSGVRIARGEYILPLDADNKIRPHYMSKAVEILDNHPEIGVVYGYAQFFGAREGIWEMQAFDKRKVLLGNLLEACSAYRRKIWEEGNGYDNDMGIMGYEDWDLWIGAMERGWKFHLVKEVLFDYRVAEGSMITTCNMPENRNYLIRYICNKHKKTYTENLDYIVAEKDVALLNAQTQLASHQEYIKGMHTHVKNFETLMAAKDELIVNLNALVRDKDVYIVNLDAAIRDKDAYIRHLDSAVRDKDIYTGHLESVIRDKDAYISHLDSAVRDKETELNNIYRSRGWKTLLFAYKIRDWLIPINSLRRLIGKAIFKSLTSPTYFFEKFNWESVRKIVYFHKNKL